MADAAYSPNPESMKIRVRIAESTPKVSIRGYDLKIFESSSSGSGKSKLVDRTSQWEFECQGEKIHAKSLMGKALEFDLNGPVSIQTPVGFLSYSTQLYRDELKIYSKGSRCEVINEMDIEKYLDGLVNSEFSSKWNSEAIAAQVVAARTYAYFQIREARKKKSHFDVDATVKDQVYDGFRKEDYQASRIVEKTRGMILTAGTKNGSLPIKAFYHSTCGGMTELPERVWGGSYLGFKRKVPCPYCVVSPRYRWNTQLKSNEIAELIQNGIKKDGLPVKWPSEMKEISKQNLLIGLRTAPVNAQSRVSEVITEWQTGKSKFELRLSSSKFRAWMGLDRIRSTAFEIYYTGKGSNLSWHIQGQGNGHGVGMCQWGAKVMGEKGFKMASILKHYYPDAILRKLW